MNKLSSLRGHQEWVKSICKFGSKSLATGSVDGSIRIWNLSDYTCANRLEGHLYTVSDLVADGECLYSCSYDKCVRMWIPAEEKCVHLIQSHCSLNTLAISNQNIFVGCNSNHIHIFNKNDRKVVTVIKDAHKGPVNDLVYRHKMLFSCSDDGTLKSWSTKTFEKLRTLRFKESVTCLCLLKGGTILTGGANCMVQQWDRNSFKKVDEKCISFRVTEEVLGMLTS